MTTRPPVLLLATLLPLAACSDTGVDRDDLASWAVLDPSDPRTLAASVEPYEVNSPLFSDHTVKRRGIAVPDGATITYDDEGPWQFPVGTILVKTFAMPFDLRDPSAGDRLLETRLFVHTAEGWRPYEYRWDEAGEVATRLRVGGDVEVELLDFDGQPMTTSYRIPSEAQCQSCHGGNDLAPIGPRTRQLDRDGQLERLAARGWLDREPGAERTVLPDPFGDDTVERRARSYLEANCAHCHNASAGPATASGLHLSWEIDDPLALGVCRRPFSAGPGSGDRKFDVVPGDPDASIMIYRMESNDPEIKMPEKPNRLIHDDGVALVRAWIEGMPGSCE